MSIGERAKGFADGNKATGRPAFVKDEHLVFLDKLRVSGATNMWGATSYVSRRFPKLGDEKAGEVLGYWMKTFGQETR